MARLAITQPMRDPLLEGEIADTLALEDATRWIRVNADLLRTLLRAAAADPAELDTLRWQGEHFERRLAFWKARSMEIADRYP